MIEIQGTEAPVQLGTQKSLTHLGQAIQPRLIQLEGKEALGVAVEDMAQSGQRSLGQGQRGPLPHLALTGGAVKHPLQQVEHGLFRVRSAAHSAGIGQRIIALQGQQLHLIGPFHQRLGLVQLVQGMERVQNQGHGGRVGPSLHRHHLHHFRKVGGQGQQFHVGFDVPELADGLGLVEGDPVLVEKEGHVGVDQQLGGGRQGAVLLPAAD